MNDCRIPALLSAALIVVSIPLRGDELALSRIVNVRDADNEAARPALNLNTQGGPLQIAGRSFASGIGVQADTSFAVTLGSATHFHALVGVDDAFGGKGSAVFEVLADGQLVWQRELSRTEPAAVVDVDLTGHRVLLLVTRDAGGNLTQASGDWADATLTFAGEAPTSVVPPSVVEPLDILTPAASVAPRINGPRVFGVRPGHPFLYQIPATGRRPLNFSARNLPEGLQVDPATGSISGRIAAAGTYRVTLVAANGEGKDEQPLRIEVGEAIALTPALGWNSWNCWAGAVDQEKVLTSAKAMASSGLVEHGWSYMNIDDTWQGTRPPPAHALQANEKFPDMKKLSAEIHALGLKLGIYSTPWITSYATYPGGSSDDPAGTWARPDGTKQVNRKIKPWAVGDYSFATADARQWADWGVDYLKYDWNPIQFPETATMANALRDSGRDIIYSLSNAAPFEHAGDWNRLANSWRTTGDIRDTWGSMSGIGFAQDRWRAFGGPGHWNDPDMLVVGYVGWGPKLHPTRLTPNEQYTHISLWSLLSAPMLIGCDLARLDAFTLNLLSNDEVLAISQDELGHQAAQTYVDGRRQVWVKALADGSHAVGFFNLAQSPQDISVAWTQLGLKAPGRVRDVWRQHDEAPGDRVTANLPRHGVLLLRVWDAPQAAPADGH